MLSRYELQLELFQPQKKSNLIWSEWSNSSLISYLNIIDFSGKRSTDAVPFCDIPSNEDEIMRYCKSTIYSLYKPYMMKKLRFEDNSKISSFLAKFMRVCDMYDVFRHGDEGSRLYCDIVNCLYDKECEDSSVMLMLWNDICARSDRFREAVFESLIGIHRTERCSKILFYVLQIAQETRFDFWGAWLKGHTLDNFSFCPVTAALLSGNVEQMKVLLQYGFQQNCQRVYIYDRHFQSFINPEYLWLRSPLVGRTSKRQGILTEVLLFLIKLCTCKSRKRCHSLQKCFQLLWDTVPEPLVTSEELLEEVENRFQSPPEFYPTTSIFCRKSLLVFLCHLYKDLNLFNIEAVVQPRSLGHLSKCRIRDVLQRRMVLPRGISTLPIPKRMQQYLNVT